MKPLLTSVTFRQGETLRWPCGAGDYLLWMRMSSPFATDGKWNIRDFWATTDGDAVTITNRWDDLPGGFELHPLEVADSLCPRMMAKLAGGYEPDEPIEGPGLWRVGTGDRVVRVGIDRAVDHGNGAMPVVVSFERSALVYGEGSGQSQKRIFGEVAVRVPQSDKARFKAGYLAGVSLGPARCMDDAWRLG